MVAHPMPEAGQGRLKTGQPELLEDEIPRGGDALHFFSDTWQAQGRLVKWVTFEAKQE